MTYIEQKFSSFDAPTFFMLVGLPGSGKSRFARELKDSITKPTIHLSSDAIRGELFGDENSQEDNARVFYEMKKRTFEALSEGKNVVYDATNITRKSRQIVAELPEYVRKECVIVYAPIEICIKRDENRERTVGRDVIDRMVKSFQPPFFDEGFDSIGVDYNYNDYIEDEQNALIDAMRIPHDSPHHTYDVYDHCIAAEEYLYENFSPVYEEYKNSNYYRTLLMAAKYHDIGKPYVKHWTNSKGEPTEYAHYYNHQNVGAYLSYNLDYSTVELAWLIGNHMEPYFNSKYYKNLPKFLKDRIDILHEADINAH